MLIDYSSKKIWEAALEHPTCSSCGESITMEEDDQICNPCFKGGYCQNYKRLHMCLLNFDIRPIYAQEVFDKRIKNNYTKAVQCQATIPGEVWYCLFCFDYKERMVQCFYCGKDDEPMCETCAVRHTVDKHPFEVATQVIDYPSLMRAEFLSKSSWWVTTKLHLEHQIEQICPTVTRLAPHGDLLMMTSSNDRATSSHGQGGSQLPSSGGRQLETKTSSESEGSEEERWCSRIKQSIGLKMSSGSDGSDE